MPITGEVIIRPTGGRPDPGTLWHGYLDVYRAVLTPEVTEELGAALWTRLAVHGLVPTEDQLAGLAHLGLHPPPGQPGLLPGRLYVAKPWRGADVARRLIEAVYAFADGVRPASTGSPGVQRRHAPNTAISASATTPSPIAPRLSCTGAELAGRFARYDRAGAFGRSAALQRVSNGRVVVAARPRSTRK